MTLQRLDWEDLPKALREQVSDGLGPIASAESVSTGMNSAVAAILHTGNGKVFVKGLRRDHPRHWNNDMEALVNPAVSHLSPRLLARHGDDEWDLLVFEYVRGRHADYSPGSDDVPIVARTMVELGRVPWKDLAVKRAVDRWARYADAADVELFAGDVLLHTDWNPENVIITADDRARLVDWAWPTFGAGWIDPACWITRLMAAGHTAASAEHAVRNVPAWQAAPLEGLRAFARANATVWREIADASSASWTLEMARVSEAWRQHRTAR